MRGAKAERNLEEQRSNLAWTTLHRAPIRGPYWLHLGGGYVVDWHHQVGLRLFVGDSEWPVIIRYVYYEVRVLREIGRAHV